MTRRFKKSKVFLIVTVIALLIIVVLCAIRLVPRYPSPEYVVDTYDDLSRAVHGVCYLPAEDVLPAGEGSFTVYVESRFTSKVAGYNMSIYPDEDYAEELVVSCHSAEIIPDEYFQITPTSYYGGVGLSGTKDHICFVLGGFRYDIDGINATDAFLEYAMTVAKNIIETHSKAAESL